MEIAAINTHINIPLGPLQRPIEPSRASTGVGEDQIDASSTPAAVGQSGATGESSERDKLSAGVGQLLSTLAQKLEQQSDLLSSGSISINVIKAGLGLQLSSLLANTNADTLDSLSADNLSGLQTQAADANVRQRLFSALATAGIDDGILFTGAGTLEIADNSGIIGALSSGQADGRDLLFGLLVDELDTAENEAIEILRTFQQSRLDIVA